MQAVEDRRLFEREDEIKRGTALLRELRKGAANRQTSLGSVLICRGGAGYGKTGLIEVFRRDALEPGHGMHVLSARGGEFKRLSPFSMVRQLLHPLIAELGRENGDEVRKQIFGNWYDVVAPALGLCAPEPGTHSDPVGVQDGLDYVLTQLAVFRSPVVLVLDDLHWADAETLTWVLGFLFKVPSLPLLLILGFRPEEMPKESLRVLEDVGPRGLGVQLEVQTLSRDCIVDMIHDAFPGEEVEELFAQECWLATRGNPLKLHNLFSQLRDRKLPLTEDSMPRLRGLVADGESDAIDRVLVECGIETTQFARVAAVLDEEFDLDLAAQVAGVTATLDVVIANLREHRLFTPTDPPTFVHPTIPAAIYQRMSPASRISFHGMVGRSLIDKGKGLAAASRHLIATRAENDPDMVEMLRRAAAEHLATGAPDAAVRCLERVLMEPPEEEDYAEVKFELGCALLLTDPRATVNHLSEALHAQPGLGPELRETAVLRLGQALGHSNQMKAAAEVTAGEFGRHEGVSLVRLQAAYYLWRSFLRQVDEDGMTQRLEELAEGLSAHEDVARAVSVLRGWDHTLRGRDTTQALLLAAPGAEGGKLHDAISWKNSTWGFEIPVLLGLVYTYNDRLDLALDLFDTGALVFETSGWSGGHLGFATFMRCLVLHRWGRFREAEAELRRTLEKAERLGRDMPLYWDTVALMIDLLLCQDRVDEAVAFAEEHRFGEPFPQIMVLPDAPTLYGRLLLARHRDAEAVRVLTQSGHDLDRRGWHHTGYAPWLGLLATAVFRQDPNHARELAAEGRKRAERIGTNSAIGIALRHSAAVAATAEEQVTLLARSVDLLGQSPVAFEHALSLVEYGSALRRTGRPREAAEMLDQGRQLAADCGAERLEARALRERGATGVGSVRLGSGSAKELTQLEMRLARLTLSGSDPREIVRQTGLSPAEVRRLLASLYRKLGTGPDGLNEALGEGY